MFERTRLQLTAWYLLIIMLISIFFSIAFYQSSTHEIERVINRIEYREQNPDLPMPNRDFRFGNPSALSLEDLENSKRQILINLIILNTAILVLAGVAGYFLAGRTLEPIRIMIDEQNQFISSASHELRTPISTLRAEMEGSLLEKNISDKEARKLIRSNLEEIGTLQELTNNLLQIAKIHDSSMKESTHDVSLLEIVLQAQKKVKPLAKKKSIVFSTLVPDSIIRADRARLIEALVIIFDNAIKYSQEKSHVTITSEETNSTVKVLVRDEGIGIPASELPRIFDRFYRVDKSRSRADGYGLGLSIAKKIVENHNGSISVKSTEGEGSTFTIVLPRLSVV